MSGIIGNNVARASGVIAAAGGGTNTPAFLVTNVGTQSMTRHAVEKVTWDTETYDTDGAFASDKFTVPVGGAGKYFFWATLSTNNNGGPNTTYMYKNGASLFYTYGTSYWPTWNFIELSADLAEADYIEIYNKNTEPSPTAQAGSWFGGFKLID
tara:strand:- start:41 stop:502 length:462 start_codon:yes stop_codon:yes gene_type:complete